MFNFVRSVLHPDAFHGHNTPPPFFEGWYFKLVSADERYRCSIIPGVFKGQDEKTSHCFVQVLDGATGQSNYHAYPFDQFWSARGRFDIHIGPNHFSPEHLLLDIHRPEQTLQGDLRFSGLSPWPVKLASPGIMGWYAWVPRMECYHGIVSLDHTIDGELTIDGQSADFSGGRGYTEKDWGKSFPSAWIWLQSNHFDVPGACITASVAVIPWHGHAFPGFIIGLWCGGALYRFATYTGAKIEKLDIQDRQVSWTVINRDLRLEMVATSARSGLLQAPTPTGMNRRIAETLNAQVSVQLSRRKGGKWVEIFTSLGRHAGLEVVGDLNRLVSMLQRVQFGSITISSIDPARKE